jgi:hypothetical protein
MNAGMYGMCSLDGLRRAAASDASQMYGGGGPCP